jgi:lipoprotein signal peptidase
VQFNTIIDIGHFQRGFENAVFNFADFFLQFSLGIAEPDIFIKSAAGENGAVFVDCAGN